MDGEDIKYIISIKLVTKQPLKVNVKLDGILMEFEVNARQLQKDDVVIKTICYYFQYFF